MQRKKVFKGRTEETVQEQQEQQHATQEPLCNNPIPRVNGTLTPWSDGILLVGGESLLKKTKGSKAGTLFHQDNLVFNMQTMQWSPLPLSAKAPSPPPRSSHQSVLLNDTTLYLWGGECELGGSAAAAAGTGTSANTKDKVKISKKKAKKDKERFMHYGGSMWSLCKGSREWKVLPSMPPATTTSKPPSSRSGHRMIPLLKDYLLLFGGFHDTGSQTQYHDDTWIFCTKTAQWTKIDCASSPAPRSGFCFANLCNGQTPTIYGGYTQRKRTSGRLEGHVFGDIWTLKFCDSECPERGGEWKKRSPLQKELAPNPLRSGMSSTVLAESNLLFLFGGICDEEGVEDEFIVGMCRNDSFIYDSSLNSWCSLRINSSSARPAPRFNATMTTMTTTSTSGEKVIIYGGMYEYGDREWILDDVWEFQLAKVGETSYEGSFTCLKEVSVELRDIFKIKEMVSEDEDDEDEDDEDDDNEDDDNEDDDNDNDNDEEEEEELSRKIPQVRKEKTLKEYFDKSQDYWIAKAKDELLEADGEADQPKIVRKLAFKMAKDEFEGQSALLSLCDL